MFFNHYSIISALVSTYYLCNMLLDYVPYYHLHFMKKVHSKILIQNLRIDCGKYFTWINKKSLIISYLLLLLMSETSLPRMISLRTPAEASIPLLGLNMIGLPKEDVTLTSKRGSAWRRGWWRAMLKCLQQKTRIIEAECFRKDSRNLCLLVGNIANQDIFLQTNYFLKLCKNM